MGLLIPGYKPACSLSGYQGLLWRAW